MITPLLEKMITDGEAEYRTFVVGASGTGNIPVPDNSFIIITDFDYWYFVDEPAASEGADAWVKVLITNPDPTAPFGIQGMNISGSPLVGLPIAIDPLDEVTSMANIQAWLDTFFLGFIVADWFFDGESVEFTIYSTPGTLYNGQIIDGSSDQSGGMFFGGAFANGEDPSPVPVEDFMKQRTHQLQFKSQNASNHFLINENIEVLYASVNGSDPDSTDFQVNVNGVYHKDTFLMHKTDVRINIIRVPQPEEWSTVYGALDNKSNEPPLPAGYGQAGIPNLDVVQEVLFNAVDEQYLPLGEKYSPQALQDYTPEFKVAAVSGRELLDPTNVSGVKGVRRNYPLINIGYVVTNKNYSKHFTNG